MLRPMAGTVERVGDLAASVRLRWRLLRERRWLRVMRPADIARFYDERNAAFLDTYGELIQACRPSSDAALLDYVADAIGLADGQRVVDAGCGVCGPSVAFATRHALRIDALTISEVQRREAEAAVKAAGLEDRIRVRCADYHRMAAILKPASYHRVFFLESLGYSHAPRRALRQAFVLLRPAGSLYLKDYFPVVPADARQRRLLRASVTELRQDFRYNTLDLGSLIRDLRQIGFRIEFIRRPGFQPDYARPWAYEKANGVINLDRTLGFDFEPYEWLEVRCLKPA